MLLNKMKNCVLSVLPLLIVLSLAACVPIVRPATPTPTTATLALVNGTLVDGTGIDAVPDAVVIIKRDRIVAVGPRAQVSIPAAARILDVQGGVILPGLIDAHVHYAYAIRDRWAAAGATTVRSLGEAGWSSGCSRKRLEGGAWVVSAGPIVTVPNGYPIRLYGAGAALQMTSAEEARQWTAKLLGPDFCNEVIKVALEGEAQLSDEELRAIVEVAHEHSARVSAHVIYSADLKKALEAGADDMAHMVVDNLPDALIDQMIARNVYVVPTLAIMSHFGIQGSNGSNLRRFVAAGGKVAVGTDYNNFDLPEDMLLLEMEMMQAAGMTPMQVIVAATKNGAHVCNLEDEMGTLEAGKIADVMVVGGDPLRDLKDLADIRMVIHDGVVIRNEIH